MRNSIVLRCVLVILCLRGFAEGFWPFDWWMKTPHRGFETKEEDVVFQLYGRKNPSKGVRLLIGDVATLLSSNFNASLPTKVCTHGYMDNAKTWISIFKTEILQVEDVNLITVDWSKCAANYLYSKVVVCMREASYYLGRLLKFLFREAGLNFNDIHMIGHSLGAHMVALAASEIPAKRVIGRITGLDPAAPLLEDQPEWKRLNPSSARFVDVIHTASFFVGVKKPIGTVDFYPNGGYFQPGCGDFDLSCHHRASQFYFINTIRKTHRYWYVSNKCTSLQHALNGTCTGEIAFMGYNSEGSSPGIYHTKVISNSPIFSLRAFNIWNAFGNSVYKKFERFIQ